MKIVEAEYIESGVFQAGEESVSLAEIKYGDDVVIIKKSDWEKIQKVFVKPKLSELDLNNIVPEFEVAPIGIQFDCQWALYLKGHNGSMCYTTDITRATLIADAWNRYRALKELIFE
jgi:hypothetical protein